MERKEGCESQRKLVCERERETERKRGIGRGENQGSENESMKRELNSKRIITFDENEERERGVNVE